MAGKKLKEISRFKIGSRGRSYVDSVEPKKETINADCNMSNKDNGADYIHNDKKEQALVKRKSVSNKIQPSKERTPSINYVSNGEFAKDLTFKIIDITMEETLSNEGVDDIETINLDDKITDIISGKPVGNSQKTKLEYEVEKAKLKIIE